MLWIVSWRPSTLPEFANIPTGKWVCFDKASAADLMLTIFEENMQLYWGYRPDLGMDYRYQKRELIEHPNGNFQYGCQPWMDAESLVQPSVQVELAEIL